MQAQPMMVPHGDFALGMRGIALDADAPCNRPISPGACGRGRSLAWPPADLICRRGSRRP